MNFNLFSSFLRYQYEACGPGKSSEVVKMFKDLIYDKFPECSAPCSFMKINTHLTTQFTEKKPAIKFFFTKEVKITSEKLQKSFSSAGTIFCIYLLLIYHLFIIMFSGRSWWIFRNGSRH